MRMKGYNHPQKPLDYTLVEENIMVCCRRCNGVWSEKAMLPKDGFRINGPSRHYDYCDKCIKDNEKPSPGEEKME